MYAGMVKVLVKSAESSNTYAFDGVAEGLDLLELVKQSRHFGPGTLETDADSTVGPRFTLTEGATFTWYAPPGECHRCSSQVVTSRRISLMPQNSVGFVGKLLSVLRPIAC